MATVAGVTQVRCFGCGAMVADAEGPTHPYMESVPGCWDGYCAIQAWQVTVGRGEAVTTLQNLVDSYAAQHATSLDRRNRQSVAVHLMSLCAGLERGISGPRRRSLIGTWTHRDYPALAPVASGYPATVAEVAAASVQSRPATIEVMARSTWSAFEVHHDTVRRWLAEVE